MCQRQAALKRVQVYYIVDKQPLCNTLKCNKIYFPPQVVGVPPGYYDDTDDEDPDDFYFGSGCYPVEVQDAKPFISDWLQLDGGNDFLSNLVD